MFTLRHYTEIDSTNLEARRLVESGDITEKTLIYADAQTAGQGSRGRGWSSNKSGNLLASYIFPVSKDWQRPHLAIYPISMAIKRFIDDLLTDLPHKTELKWPNDILLNEQKICGSLHEIISYKQESFLIAGIGININWHPQETTSLFPATSVAALKPIDIPMEELVTHLGQNIEQEVSRWREEGFITYVKSMVPYFYRFGEMITVHPSRDRKKEIKGIFQGIDLNGALVLKTAGGIEKITTADIFPNLSGFSGK